MKNLVKIPIFLTTVLCSHLSLAVGSAELYSSKSYGYGRFEARLRFAPGDGVVSSFFLWKDGSEKSGTFWNELDFEKLGADCHVQTNPLYGNPVADHSKQHPLQLDLCGAYHTYTYEWTPEAIVWLVDGAEIRRETGATAQAFADNATAGMQIHFNVWPGDATFGGNFSPSALPVHQYIDWVQYSAYQDGAFTLSWREDFSGSALPSGWLTGDWGSPKNHSTHAPENVNYVDGFAVLSLTADNALGPAGAMPAAGSSNGESGATGVGGSPASAGSANNPATGGSAVSGGNPSAAGSASTSTDNGCSLGQAPARGAFWWLLGIPTMTAVIRRVRRLRKA
ncbi:MAG TPA: family 16 glycosylhydrolase [Polyangiaceae bacterium]|nr:family 16 glycosylhydrolase [Polyangiaceae bacterium]